MPRGLLIDFNDGSPRMEITAGLRCPSYSGETQNQGGINTLAVRKTPGSTMLMLPRTTTFAGVSPTQLVPDIGMLTGFTDNNDGTVTQHWWSTNPKAQPVLGSSMYAEVLPVSQSGNRGLLISDSTDFTVLPSDTQFMGCIWSGNFVVNGTTPLPAAGIPFAAWDAPGISIAFDGTNLKSYLSGDFYGDAPRAVTIRLAIFGRKNPVPGRGLNFVNSQGTVTFSTTSKPFVFRNTFWNPVNGPMNISGSMIMVCNTGFRNRNAGGWCNMKDKGMMMAGGMVSSASSSTKLSWTDRYPIIDERTINLNIPMIPAMY